MSHLAPPSGLLLLLKGRVRTLTVPAETLVAVSLGRDYTGGPREMDRNPSLETLPGQSPHPLL